MGFAQRVRVTHKAMKTYLVSVFFGGRARLICLLAQDRETAIWRGIKKAAPVGDYTASAKELFQ